MNKIIIDTETSGLPTKLTFDNFHHPSLLDKYDSARVIELGYIICSDSNNIIKKVDQLVKPVDFKIENSFVHGLEHDYVLSNGKDIKQVLDQFTNDILSNDIGTIIAHNINFDINIILSEYYRLGHENNKDIIAKLEEMNKEDTMKIGKDHMKTKKSPKLIELYKFLFNEEFAQDHRALSDADACLKCYFKLKAS